MATKQSISLSSALSQSWQLYTQQFRAVMPTSTISYLLLALLFYFLEANNIKSLNSTSSVVYGFIEVQIMILVYQKLTNAPKLTANDAPVAQETNKRVLQTWGLQLLLTTLSALLLIVPAILFSVWWAFGPYIALDTKLSGMDALKKSKEFTKGHFGKLFLAGTLRNLFVVGAFVIPHFFFPELIGEITGALLASLVVPYFAILLFVFYRDSR